MTDLRTLENDSIRAFVQSAADEGYLSGRVLDYGCGKQPYRDIVQAAGGEYWGYDSTTFPGSTLTEGSVYEKWDALYPYEEWDAILCTQVVQYLPIAKNAGYPEHWPLVLWEWNASLNVGGHLVLTYPTNWPEVEPEDLHRFTKAGMERLLTEAGFEIVRHERRASVYLHYPMNTHLDEVALGHGVICRA